MKKLFLVLAIVTLVAVGAFAADMYTNADANVRKGPSTNFDVVGTLAKGTRVTIIDTSGSWYRIKAGNIEGYVSSSLLSGSGSSSSGSSDVKNFISGEVSFFGGGARYERMLTDKMSIGANAYYNYLIIWNEFEAGGSFRFYPASFFFVGGGVGFHMHDGTYSYEDYSGYSWSEWGRIYGISVTPEVGFKFDFGDKGGFFIQPGVKVPVTFGVLESYYGVDGGFRVGFGVVPYCGFGFAW